MGLRIGLVVTAALLVACAEMPKPPPADAEATAEAGYGRAFGRVQLVQAGSEVRVRPGFLVHQNLKLFLRPAPSGPVQELDISEDGGFVWPLRPGEYTLLAFEYLRSSGVRERSLGRLMTTFAVPKAGQAVYVGDLRLDDRSGFSVLDRYGEALKQVEGRLAEGKLEPMKGLMRAEPRTGSYRGFLGICNPTWQVDCKGNYQGVEPVRPADAAHGFPITESLKPELEWKPAGGATLRYDVSIYESLDLSDLATVRRLHGALVDYAEGLREPRYAPAVPLQPGRRYEWSVRLRDEHDIVSTWSTTSSTVFLVIAGARRSGRSFGFETPAK